MAAQQPDQLRPLSDHLAVARRQRWLILTVLTAAVLLAAALTQAQPRSYEATVAVALEPTGARSDLERLLFGATDLGTQQEIIRSDDVVRPVLGGAGAPTDAESVRSFAEDAVTIEILPGSTVLRIQVVQSTAEGAAELAQALADQYLVYLKADAEQRVAEAVTELRTTADAARAEIEVVNAQLAAADPARAASLEEERDQLFTSVRFASTRITELETTSALARLGVIIEPAVAPGAPSSPNLVRNLALALVLGALAASGAAVVRDRRNYVLRTPQDFPRGVGVPWIATLPGRAISGQASGSATAGAVTDVELARLRPALLPAGRSQGGSPLAVVPVGPGVPAAALALGLAHAAVEVGHATTLIAGGASAAGGGADGAGDVVPPGSVASDALVRPGGETAALRVVPVGEGVPGGADVRLLRALDQVGADPGALIVSTPPLAASAEALDVAARSRGVLLVVSAGTSTKNEWVATVEELERVGAPVIGAILLQGR